MTRQVTVCCTQFGSTQKIANVTDGVTTLQDLMNQLGITGNNWTAMGRPTKTPYVLAQDGTPSAQIINSEDSMISFYPMQMKAGNSSELSRCKTELEALEILVDRIFDKIQGIQETVGEIKDDIEVSIDNLDDVPASKSMNEPDDYTKRILGLGLR